MGHPKFSCENKVFFNIYLIVGTGKACEGHVKAKFWPRLDVTRKPSVLTINLGPLLPMGSEEEKIFVSVQVRISNKSFLSTFSLQTSLNVKVFRSGGDLYNCL